LPENTAKLLYFRTGNLVPKCTNALYLFFYMANVKRFFDTVAPQNPKHLNKFNTWLKEGFY